MDVRSWYPESRDDDEDSESTEIIDCRAWEGSERRIFESPLDLRGCLL